MGGFDTLVLVYALPVYLKLSLCCYPAQTAELSVLPWEKNCKKQYILMTDGGLGGGGLTPPHTRDSQTWEENWYSHSHTPIDKKKQAYVLHKSPLKIAGQPTSWQASLDCLIMKCLKHLQGCQSGFKYVTTHSPLLDFQWCYHFGIYGWWNAALFSLSNINVKGLCLPWVHDDFPLTKIVRNVIS